jgi:hypothetical protein
MTDDPVGEAIRLAKLESSFRAINHLRRCGKLSEDDWFRIETDLPINGGRKPSELTAADEAHRRKFYDEVCSRCRLGGLKGDPARERVAREIYSRYEQLPSGKRFEWSRAAHIAKRGLSKVRKHIP